LTRPSCRSPVYEKELQSPHRLNKHDVTAHLRQYSSKFNLNVVSSARIQSSIYNTGKKKWTITFKIHGGNESKTIVCQHLVQATGLGCGKPNIPPIEGENRYQGTSVHSAQYRSAQLLKDQGVKVMLSNSYIRLRHTPLLKCYL
jgi:cation diffusion facilitator CzcD-associated flavoprotein CzcO